MSRQGTTKLKRWQIPYQKQYNLKTQDRNVFKVLKTTDNLEFFTP